MNPKRTWFWLFIALGLFGLILVLKPYAKKAPAGPPRILPTLQPAAVTAVLVRNAEPSQLAIRADRTNQAWQLTEPVSYPAQSTNIDSLLIRLEQLTPAAYITPGEYRSRPKADEEYGFAAPQASLTLWQGDDRTQVLFGALTVPGDQVFLEVVGIEGAYVVDSDILKLIPRSPDDWRETAVIDLDGVVFNRLAVTNNGKAVILQREAPDRPWGIVSPSPARANNARIADALQKLQALRVKKFLPEDAKPDSEMLGLAPPQLELGFLNDSNAVALLQFGKNPTNDSALVYAQRAGQKVIFTVPGEPLALWKLSLNDFRDPHLVALSAPLEEIEVHGQETFSLQRQPDESWRIQSQNFPVDEELVADFLSTLTNLGIVQFTTDAVTPPDLVQYGLAAPVLEYVLKPASATGVRPASGATLVDGLSLSFGSSTNQPDKIFARRSDESSIYAVNSNQFARLPSAICQFRDRRPWHFSETEVAGVTIRQQGKERKLLHRGPGEWSLAPGSSGIIDPLAVEATVSGLAQVSATWVARGEENRARYGLTTDSRQIILELKNGENGTVTFGGEAPNTDQYAAVTLDGQLWIFECSWRLYRDVLLYLSAF
jgi:hypothetical protein